MLAHILEQAIFIGSFNLGNIRLLAANGDTLRAVVARAYRDPENVASHRATSRNSVTAQSSYFKDELLHQPCTEESVQLRWLRTFKKEEFNHLSGCRFAPKFMGGCGAACATLRGTKRQARELESASKLQADFCAMIDMIFARRS